MRLPFLPPADRSGVGGRSFLPAVVIAVLLSAVISWLMLGCSPRSFSEVNKQAPRPDVYGERPGLSGHLMYAAQYLRDTEPLDD